MEFFHDHKKLFRAAFLFFLVLTLFACILPALDEQKNNATLPGSTPLSEDAAQGKLVFIANGCVACHTQQVRNVDMDKTWGSRPSVAADYAGIHRTDVWRNTATLMGTERTGPDLTNIGARQPAASWQLMHLFNPRSVVKESIMPAYPWLFTMKETPGKEDVVVSVPDEFLDGTTGKVVATKEALQLVAYLQSLKQTELPGDGPVPAFLELSKKRAPDAGGGAAASNGDAEAAKGAQLYTTYCQTCHQSDGQGLKGAFPPLKGSKVVLDDNPELMVNIIINGYTGRMSEGFGAMPAVGTLNNLKPEEITAIMNHEKSSWGNDAKKVDVATIEKFIKSIKK
ncbi:cbb3-type cytochrome c oxidase subunit II [Puia dinghuensis]|uniref:Cytochrome-c oxidase n=1 Tax=Puia dinghuensis TaxID=1792502 RepID=A0A8J2UEA5_9BACT|nr:cbb3-type cytochrome c oxidase subunit II [Puia dinghuensis]GGB03394.1 cytochrome-c oxidase [Puia dinghuensis]